jgi:hypothetical protein
VMRGGLARMIGKMLAGLLLLLVFGGVPLPASAHAPQASVSYQPQIASIFDPVRAEPCSGPAGVNGPSCCLGMSCFAGVAQSAEGSPIVPVPPAASRRAHHIAQSAFPAGTHATPAPPPPRSFV